MRFCCDDISRSGPARWQLYNCQAGSGQAYAAAMLGESKNTQQPLQAKWAQPQQQQWRCPALLLLPSLLLMLLLLAQPALLLLMGSLVGPLLCAPSHTLMAP